MITLYAADSRQNAKNCCYPHKAEVTDAESFKRAVARDYTCASFRGGYRNIDNFQTTDCVGFDVDNDHSDLPSEWVTPQDVANAFPGVEFYVHFSRSNMREKNGKAARPKFHVLFPIRDCDDAEAYAALKQEVYSLYPYFDENALDAARFFFGTEDPEVDVWPGVRDLTQYLEKLREIKLRTETGEAARKGNDAFAPADAFVQHKADGTVFSLIPRGQRNSTLHRFAVKTMKRYGASERARELFDREAQRCDPPLALRELESIWRSAEKFYAGRIVPSKDYTPPDLFGRPAVSLKPPDYSDIGQAKVLVREYRDELLYTEATDFLRYDGVKWVESRQQAVGAMEEFLDLQLADAEDEIRQAMELIGRLSPVEFTLAGGTKQLDKQAADLKKSGQTEAARALEKAEQQLQAALQYHNFVMRRRDMSFILSALAAAKPMVQKVISDLDRDEFQLNTPGATYNLRCGMAGGKPHEPQDLITKVTAVDPSEKGKDLWLSALDTFFCGDAELIDYVQQIAGLAAVGKIFLEAIIIAYGEGRNGKSTFWNTLSRVLGSYSGQISADTLTVGVKRNVKPEMAELKGKRLVIAAELEEGMRLNTSVIKQLCSTDAIFAEKKYRDPFQFIPSHTLVLYTNHLPRVGAMDAGTWRRLIVIPFLAKIEGKSDIKNYTDFLVKNAGEYVLQWVIEGAQKVIDNSFTLSLPACVQAAIGEYRSGNDWLANFLDECCEVDEAFQEKSGLVYQEYREMCHRNGEWARSTTDFYTALENAGFKRKRTSSTRYLIGLRLKPIDPVI